jgi:hypothetical protein
MILDELAWHRDKHGTSISARPEAKVISSGDERRQDVKPGSTPPRRSLPSSATPPRQPTIELTVSPIGRLIRKNCDNDFGLKQ